MLAQPAAAQSNGAYVGRSTNVPATDPVTTRVATAAATPTATPTQGTLPLTGSDVVGLVSLGRVLVMVGATAIVVRRHIGRTTDSATTSAASSALLTSG